MLYHKKTPKLSRLRWLLGGAAFGIGAWVGVYLAYFHAPMPPSPSVERDGTLPPTQEALPLSGGYVGSSFSGSYLAGRFAQSQQQLGDAAEHLMRAIQWRHEDAVLKQQALHTLVAAGQMEEAARISTGLAESKTTDPLAVLVACTHLARQGRFSYALSYAELPKEIGIYAMIKPMLRQWLAAGEKLPLDKPVVMPDVVERSGFLAPFMHYQLALINDMSGHFDVAERHYKAALGTPDLMPYRVMQAVSNFYLRRGNVREAQRIFDDYARQNPDSELIEASLPQKDKPAHSVVPLVENPVQGLAEILFTTASLLFGEQITSEATVYLQLALYLRPDFPPAQMMMANIYEQNGHYDLAIETYRGIDPSTRFFKRGQLRMAMNHHLLDDQQKATGLLRQLQNENPDDPEPLIVMADMLRVKKDYKQAVFYYTRALSKKSANKKSNWSLHYMRGICHERAGLWEEAQADFEKALKLSPDQPDVLNYLGYSWLVQRKNIARARYYIEKALEQRPSDAHIIDSMGWALYVTGEFEEALDHMEQAADLAPQDATINDHLGDVYWRLNRKIEARYQWERALLFEPEDVKKIEAKIEKGLPEFEVPSKRAMGDFEAPVTASDDKQKNGEKAEPALQ